MKIIVCLKEVIDTRLDLGYGQVSDALLQKGMSFKLDPDSLRALAGALQFKQKVPAAEIILLALGPGRVEGYLRDGIALGADKAIRLWDESFRDLSAFRKTRVLSGAIAQLNADLVLVGNKSLDSAGGLTGALIGAWLNIPSLCEVTVFEIQKGGKSALVVRNAGKGLKEKLQVVLPAVLVLTGPPAKLPCADLDALLKSRESEIACLSLSDLGITPQQMKNDPLRSAGLTFPRPRPRPAPLDSSLPAFFRILTLLQGSIARRRGEMLRGSTDEMVDQLFNLLVKENVIKAAAKK